MVRAKSLPQRGAGRDERRIDVPRRSVNGSPNATTRAGSAYDRAMPSIPGQPADTT
jgi:hypothetical protein